MATSQLYGWYEEDGTERWQQHANCIGVDPDLFFPDTSNAYLAYKQTRSLCAECVVREECTEYALETNVGSGMWGGMTALELRRERKRRARETRDNGM